MTFRANVILFAGLTAVAVSANRLPAAVPVVLKQGADPQQIRQWRDLKFGMFIHWGPSVVLGGQWKGKTESLYQEFVMYSNHIPLDEYRKASAEKFNPVKFDANELMGMAKAAGMRYVVFTAKHHDGFAMYHSDVSRYNVFDATPCHRDIAAELRQACDRQGLKLGFYYSHSIDWEDPNATSFGYPGKTPYGDRKILAQCDWFLTHPEMIPAIRPYVDGKCIPQLQELIRKYDPFVLWLDCPFWTPESENLRILAAIRAANPKVIVNSRVAWPPSVAVENAKEPWAGATITADGAPVRVLHGDYLEGADNAYDIPVYGVPYEGHMSTNFACGYFASDKAFRSPEYFIRLISRLASKGGNILLNVGPKPDGQLPEEAKNILRHIGVWMSKHGEAIYATDPLPLPIQNWGYSTYREGKIYLHIHHWPQAGTLRVGGLKNHIRKAYWLEDAQKQPLAVTRTGELDLAVALPANPPDPVVPVMVLEIDGKLQADRVRLLETSEVNQLHVFDEAKVEGKITYEREWPGHDHLRDWCRKEDRVVWNVRAAKPGKYRVVVEYGSAAASGKFAVTIGSAEVDSSVQATGDPGKLMGKIVKDDRAEFVYVRSDYVKQTDFDLGEIDVPAGRHELIVSAVELPPGKELMRLRSVTLVPAK